jgi:hypothetical protein
VRKRVHLLTFLQTFRKGALTLFVGLAWMTIACYEKETQYQGYIHDETRPTDIHTDKHTDRQTQIIRLEPDR